MQKAQTMYWGPVERLIPIAEFVATLAVAYVGLDKIGKRDASVNKLAADIEDINEKVLRRWQPVVNGKLKILYDSDDLYKMAHVTREWLPEPDKARKKRITSWARKHCPLLHFFVDRKDIPVAYVIFACATAMFFALSLLSIFEIKAPSWAVLFIHLAYVICSLWIFYSAYASFKIYALLPEMVGARKNIEARQEQIAEENLKQSVQSAEAKAEEALVVKGAEDALVANNPSIAETPGR